MPVPAAARLIEFKPAPKTDLPRAGALLFPLAKTQAEPPVDAQAERVAEALQRGRNEGREEARSEFEMKLFEAETAFEERLVAERSQWAAEQGDALAKSIEQAFTTLSDEIGDAVAAILVPLVEEALRKRIVEELLRTLEKVLKGGRPATLKMSGPSDLLDLVRQSLGVSAAAIEFEATSDLDVRVLADRTMIETQLEAWLQRIGGRGS